MTARHESRSVRLDPVSTAVPEQSSEASEASDARAKPFPAYALNKCLIGYGLINGIINAIVFRLMYLGQESVTFGYGQVVADLAMTSVFIGVILFLCAAPLTKMDLRHGRVRMSRTDGLATLVPRRYPLAVLSAAVFTCVATTGVTALVAMLLPMPLGVIPMMVLKGVLCGFAGGVSGLLAIAYAVRAARSAHAA